jgi:hypothetical protein
MVKHGWDHFLWLIAADFLSGDAMPILNHRFGDPERFYSPGENRRGQTFGQLKSAGCDPSQPSNSQTRRTYG